MESTDFPDLMTSPCNYCWASICMFGYEFFGVVLLVLAINISEGNVAAIGVSLFVILLISGPLTGGHHNPAVSLGVLINKEITYSRSIQFLIYISAQFLGAILAAEICLKLVPDKEKGFSHLP